MARWQMYIDDSASHGALLDKKFQPFTPGVNGLQPITSAGGILIPESAERAIRLEVQDLRRKIKRALGCSELPELHMRLMWGKNLPQKNNPYFDHQASDEQLFRWVKYGYDIIHKYIKSGQLKVVGVSLDIKQVQSVLLMYVNDPDIQQEYAFIKHHFPKATADFYRIMFNPISRMILNLIAAGDFFCQPRMHSLSVFYDTSEASKGFAASEGMEILHQTNRFQSVDKINESSARESDLMQLADLVAYRIFRGRLMRYRLANDLPNADDSGIHAALRYRSMSAGGLDIPIELRLESLHESLFAMLQTAYARRSIEEKYPDAVAELLIPLKSYRVDLDEHGTLTGFFQIVKPQVLEAWINGKRPPQ